MMLCVRVYGVEGCFMWEQVRRLVLLYGVVYGGITIREDIGEVWGKVKGW